MVYFLLAAKKIFDRDHVWVISSQSVGAFVVGNAENPRLKACFKSKTSQGPVGFEKGVLEQVFCFQTVSNEVHDQVIHCVPVLVIKLSECNSAPGLRGAHALKFIFGGTMELKLGLDIHLLFGDECRNSRWFFDGIWVNRRCWLKFLPCLSRFFSFFLFIDWFLFNKTG